MTETNKQQAFIKLIGTKIPWDNEIERALNYVSDLPHEDKSQPCSLDVVHHVLALSSDRNTVIATLLTDPKLHNTLDQTTIKREFGSQVATLTNGINQLHTLQEGKPVNVKSAAQAEKLRRLLMAIISDVRVMLIELCYRLEQLKRLKYSDYNTHQQIAQETMDIFAPLANRLGLGLIKWEMEDLAFRILEPQIYKRIARLLEEKRSQREIFIHQFTEQLNKRLQQQGIKATVSGRVKHIVSIWRKMRKKNLEFHQLFDVRAVRVLVHSVADCYAVLGIVHTSWQHIPHEFDDYIANPKANGYQSLHTAIIADSGQIVEVQIRSYTMHEKSEFGVASHWRYKEGLGLDQQLENSILTMREMLEGSEEAVSDVISEISTEWRHDRVYVFTPQGQVIDLAQGGTPLDFAYSIHSELGHRCRGAKVNGRIVTLNTVLQTGDEVEILTTREGRPSRDWMNKNLGFIKSASIRSKVRNWFNHQDLEQNVSDGKNLFERTLSKYSVTGANLKNLTKHFKRKDTSQFFADIGRGKITSAQIIGYLGTTDTNTDSFKKIGRPESKNVLAKSDVRIHGVGNLLTQFARCCKPVPGDSIIGFITTNTGITIHNTTCSNLLALAEDKRQRLIEVEWYKNSHSVYPVEISIVSFQRTTLMQDISTVLANLKINMLNIYSTSNRDEAMVYTRLTVEIRDTDELVSMIEKLSQIINVQEVKRIA